MVEDELDVLVAGPGKRHHEHPSLSALTLFRVPLGTGVTEIDLGFLAGSGLDPDEGFGLFGMLAVQETSHRGITAGVALFVAQPPPNRGPFHTGVDQNLNGLFVRVHRASHVARRGRRSQQRHEILEPRQRFFRVQKPRLVGSIAVFADGISGKDQGPGDLPDTLAFP